MPVHPDLSSKYVQVHFTRIKRLDSVNSVACKILQIVKCPAL